MVKRMDNKPNDTPIRASDDFLGNLHVAVANHLAARMASGNAEAAEVNAAIKFLKDNKIEALANDPHLQNLANKMASNLPEFDSEEMDDNE